MKISSTHVPEIEPKKALDAPLYAISAGRSMVEMLGVLAIIGVLSVGAIAGYSKAMFKQKLNKQTEQINTLLNNIESYSDLWVNMKGSGYHQIPLLKKLKAIPEEMIRPNNDNFIYDILGNRIAVVYNSPNEVVPTGYFELVYYIREDSMQKDVCFNLLQAAKVRSAFLYKTGICAAGKCTGVLGDTVCTKNKLCLKDLGITEMNNICEYPCTNDYCYMYMSFGQR